MRIVPGSVAQSAPARQPFQAPQQRSRFTVLKSLGVVVLAAAGLCGCTDAPKSADAGPSNTGSADAGIPDAGSLDAAQRDASLQDAAPAPDAAPADADAGAPDAAAVDGGPDSNRCATGAQCPTDLVCTGIGAEGSGRCRDLTPIAGEGDMCGADGDCRAGLICTQTSPGGVCVPDWMLGTFDGKGLEIPDDDPAGITDEINVFGLGTVSTEVVLRLRLEHGRSPDVRIYLSNPSGTEALAYNGNLVEEPVAPVVTFERRLMGFPGDESANGRWVLRAVDLDPAETGRIVSWSITLRSRFD